MGDLVPLSHLLEYPIRIGRREIVHYTYLERKCLKESKANPEYKPAEKRSDLENLPWYNVLWNLHYPLSVLVKNTSVMIAAMREEQPPSQALRLSQGRGERLVTSRKRPWEGYRRLSPSRLPLRAHFHRKREVWVRGSEKNISPFHCFLQIFQNHECCMFLARKIYRHQDLQAN